LVLLSLQFVALLAPLAVADEPPATAALEPFNVKDCTGPAAGKTLCYYCRYELRPVVCVFVERIDEHVGELVASVDAAVARNKAQRLAAFVVYLGGDTETAERELRALAAARKITNTPLTIYRDTPEKLSVGLGVSREAPLTIRYWREGTIVGEELHRSTRLGDEGLARLVSVLEKLAATPPLNPPESSLKLPTPP
jgi:hypothetical protein